MRCSAACIPSKTFLCMHVHMPLEHIRLAMPLSLQAWYAQAAEVGGVLACAEAVVAEAQRDSVDFERSASPEPPPSSAVDTSRVTLIGHSFGASTALRTAAALQEAGKAEGAPVVEAVVALDPWISGFDLDTHGAPHRAIPSSWPHACSL